MVRGEHNPTGVRCTGLRGGLTQPPTVEPDPDHAGAGRSVRCLSRSAHRHRHALGRDPLPCVRGRRRRGRSPVASGPGRGRRHRPGGVRADRGSRCRCAGRRACCAWSTTGSHVALAAGADGVHVGADDLPVAAARRVLGPARGARRDLPRRGGRRGRRWRPAPPTSASGRRSRRPPRTVCRRRSGRPASAAVVAAVPGTPVIAIGGVDAVHGAAALDRRRGAAVSRSVGARRQRRRSRCRTVARLLRPLSVTRLTVVGGGIIGLSDRLAAGRSAALTVTVLDERRRRGRLVCGGRDARAGGRGGVRRARR